MAIGIIISLSCFCFLFLDFLYKRTNAYRNRDIYIRKYLRGVPKRIKIANFGSTYSEFAFNNYDELGLVGFNFALPCHGLEMDYVILRRYSSYLAPGCVVVFCVAAFVMLYRYDMRPDAFHYYKILDKDEIPDYNPIDKFSSKWPLFPFHVRRIFRIIKDVPFQEDIVGEGRSYSRSQGEKAMRKLVDVWKKMFLLSDLSDTQFSDANKRNIEFNSKLLEEMVVYCKKSGWIPVIVIPPFSEVLNAYFSKGFIQVISGRMLEHIKKEHEVPVFDYRLIPDFQKNLSLFTDGGFLLSKKGSYLFMEGFLHDLAEYKKGIRYDKYN